MRFVECEFKGQVPEFPQSVFERCRFEVDDIKELPGTWKCVDCVVVIGGKELNYGESSN